MPEYESQAFEDFKEELHRRNLGLLRIYEAKRLVESALLNIRLNTEVYRPPSWYWRDYKDFKK